MIEMTKPLNPVIVDILKQFDLKPSECLWDCKGTWVMMHRYLEQVAARAGITFGTPDIIRGQDSITSDVVVLLGSAKLGDREEWTFGEAAPNNNKNPYPWAMAEKRLKDRLTLKLIGLHGHVYSEEEADEFKHTKKEVDLPPDTEIEYHHLLDTIRESIWDRKTLLSWWNSEGERARRKEKGLSKEQVDHLKSEINRLHPAEKSSEQAT